MIPDSTVQQIKDAAKIEDVVGHYIELKQSGTRLKALCPFHDERTPSFYVTPSKGIYKCFGCDKGGDAISFVMEYTNCTYPEALEAIASIYNISTESGHHTSSRRSQCKSTPRPAPPKPPTAYIPKKDFRDSLKNYDRNNFASFLVGRFGKKVAERLIGRYLVGTSEYKEGANTFWYKDCSGNVRTGKVMVYDGKTGKRSRTTDPTWVHAKNLLNIKDTSVCWYGEHLLPKNPGAPVGIVESEKTAIIASLYFPDTVWLGAGGKSLAADKWPPLRGRKVMLFPDADPPDKNGNSPFITWSKEAEALCNAGYLVQVSDLLEREATPEQRAGKWDLADYLLQYDPAEFHAMSAPQPPREQNTTFTAQVQAHKAEADTAPHKAHSGMMPTAPALPAGYERQPFTDATTGDPVKVLLNADGYPADWDLEPSQREALAKVIEANPVVNDVINQFELTLESVERIE